MIKNTKLKFRNFFILTSDLSIRKYLLFIIKERSLVDLINMIKSFNARRQREVNNKWKHILFEVNQISVDSLLKRYGAELFRTLPLSSCSGNFRSGNYINFSSIMYKLDCDMILWGKNYGDNECNMYLHRLGWVLHVLSNSRRVPWDYVFSWVDWHNGNKNKNHYEYDVYTVSERLCNLLYF